MKALKIGSEAHRNHMSKVMKESWARRRNKIAARNEAKKVSVAEMTCGGITNSPVKRFVAFNFCPNCGEHLSRMYPYKEMPDEYMH